MYAFIVTLISLKGHEETDELNGIQSPPLGSKEISKSSLSQNIGRKNATKWWYWRKILAKEIFQSFHLKLQEPTMIAAGKASKAGDKKHSWLKWKTNCQISVDIVDKSTKLVSIYLIDKWMVWDVQTRTLMPNFTLSFWTISQYDYVVSTANAYTELITYQSDSPITYR